MPAPFPTIESRMPLAIPTTMPSMKAPAKRRQKPARAPASAPTFMVVSMASRMTRLSDGGRVVPRHLDPLQKRRVVLQEDVVPPRRARVFEGLRREQPEELPAGGGIVGRP